MNEVVFTLLQVRLPLKAFYGKRAFELASLGMQGVKVRHFSSFVSVSVLNSAFAFRASPAALRSRPPRQLWEIVHCVALQPCILLPR